MLAALKKRAKQLKLEIYTLYLAVRDSDTPWYVRLLIMGIVAYAASPIDLIPDFIPVLGYLDDLILLPLAITLAVKLLPDTVLDRCRKKAHDELQSGLPVNRIAAVVVVLCWVGAIGLILQLFANRQP